VGTRQLEKKPLKAFSDFINIPHGSDVIMPFKETTWSE
jgi:hypothetical protein